jgi:secreted PhoX family phosphatase
VTNPDTAARPSDPFSVILTRRRALQAAAGVAFAASAGKLAALAQSGPRAPFDFADLPLKVINDHAVPESYSAEVLIRWGDPVLKGAPPFVAEGRPASAQAAQFGAGNDFIGYFPLPAGSQASDHGLLAINHEFTSYRHFFPGVTNPADLTADQIAADQAAHGLSVIEVQRRAGRWSVVAGSRYARRITAQTRCVLSGPAAGSPRVRTVADPSGRNVLGTIANCSGGKTPWGTVLSAEENFQNFFRGAPPEEHPEYKSLAEAGIAGKGKSPWGLQEYRWDAGLAPQEPNRFGYIVEFDPYAPKSVPVKRTHLGRFRHEAASVVIAADGRVCVYLGEDRAGGFLYRFVSSKPYLKSMTKDEAGALLDEGILFVARFTETEMTWLPLLPGQGALAAFPTLADVLIDAPLAARAAGGTPMDRPEDMEVNPVNGNIYVNLTMNPGRKPEETDPANPRGPNEDGHLLEIVPSGGDHRAASAAWSVFMLCGPPDAGAKYGPGTATMLSGPDNLAFDPKGRLWIATDNKRWEQGTIPNGLFASQVDGPDRASVRFFFNVPTGAELCGPEFTPDGETLFVAVQDPDADPSGSGLNWPDRRKGFPPRSSVVVVTRKGGGPIGG